MSGSGPFGPMCQGVWQSWQPEVVTRYSPSATGSWASAAQAGRTRAATATPRVRLDLLAGLLAGVVIFLAPFVAPGIDATESCDPFADQLVRHPHRRPRCRAAASAAPPSASRPAVRARSVPGRPERCGAPHRPSGRAPDRRPACRRWLRSPARPPCRRRGAARGRGSRSGPSALWQWPQLACM